MKRLWISVKRGLIREPKHRLEMGECIWLFQYMLDIADWETGKIPDWKDQAAADDMQMPIRTLREQRRKLEDALYIASTQKQYGQEVTIKNWTNPRSYTGEVLNPKQGDSETVPQGYTQGSSQDVTPTSDSNIKQEQVLSSKDYEQVNAKVDAMITNSARADWTGREAFRPDHYPLVDWYHKVTGQVCGKKQQKEWRMAVTDWTSNALTVADLQAAYDMDIKWLHVYKSPNQLTKTAIALKAQKQAQPKEMTRLL